MEDFDDSEGDFSEAGLVQGTNTGTDTDEENDSMAKRIIESHWFTFTVAAAIMLNVMTMTLQVDMAASPGHEATDGMWDIIDNIFLVFFTVEIVLRLTAVGCFGFFCKESDDQGWNLFDFFVVGTCWMINLTESVSFTGDKFIKLLRSARMLRILRVLRIFRLPCMKKLNIIVAGLVHSFSVVSWIAVMLGGVMFLSGIVCTDVIGKNAKRWGEDEEEIKLLFGGMKNSTITLFNFLTLADWSGVTRLVAKEEPSMTFFFLAYVIFAAMVILSLLTGVLADHMNTVREAEEKAEAEEARAQRAVAVKAELKAFRQADIHGRHMIGKEQFMNVLQSPAVRDELDASGVNIGAFDLDDLFECFDSKASGAISWNEFRQGMEELRIGVTPKQIFKLEVSLQRATRECRDDATMTVSADKEDQAEVPLKQLAKQMDSTAALLDRMATDLSNFQVPAGFPEGLESEEDESVE